MSPSWPPVVPYAQGAGEPVAHRASGRHGGPYLDSKRGAARGSRILAITVVRPWRDPLPVALEATSSRAVDGVAGLAHRLRLPLDPPGRRGRYDRGWRRQAAIPQALRPTGHGHLACVDRGAQAAAVIRGLAAIRGAAWFESLSATRLRPISRPTPRGPASIGLRLARGLHPDQFRDSSLRWWATGASRSARRRSSRHCP